MKSAEKVRLTGGKRGEKKKLHLESLPNGDKIRVRVEMGRLGV